MYLLTKVKPIGNMRMKFAWPIEKWGAGVGVEAYQEEYLKQSTHYQILNSLQDVDDMVKKTLGDGANYRDKQVYESDVHAVTMTFKKFIDIIIDTMVERNEVVSMRYVVFGSDDDLHVIAIEKE